MSSTPIQLPGRPAPPPLTLYVHLPWCERKCPYCDFNSHAVDKAAIPEAEYLAALKQDLIAALPLSQPVTSVFIGGGTPSLFSAAGIDKLLSDIRMLVNLVPQAEITLEANPGSVEAARFAEYAAAGVTRLSLGVQSLDDDHLHSLGRIHDAQQARRAAAIATENFANVNLDLMTALPQQDVSSAVADAEQVCALGATHLSLYRLMLEPGSVFFRRPPAGLPDHDLAADCEDAARAVVATAGYARYEISAHSLPQAEALHNLNYWRFGDYLGIGAGAHSKLTTPDGVMRLVRHKAPQRYLEAATTNDFVATSQRVGTAELAFEFMLNALRLVAGFSVELFRQRTGLTFASIEEQIATAVANEWVEANHEKIIPTPRGLDFYNDLCMLFLPSPAPKLSTREFAHGT